VAELIVLEEVASTQDEVHRLAAEGAAHGTAVLARRQGRGRGSRGREWSSPEGGLWLSVLWRAGPSADGVPDAGGVQLLGIRAGLAIARVIEAGCPVARVQLKWPNDVLVDNRKVGGILCEAKWQGGLGWVAIGVGLNVQNPVPADLRFPAASLGGWCPTLGVDPLAKEIVGRLGTLGTEAELTEEEMGDWAARDWLAGRPVRAPWDGVASGITAMGRLRVTGRDGVPREIVAGDGFAL
jgi:BirA family biotin operon repressor/biotin-[acetyl-CoA-carboxylase] ligase